MGENLLGIKEFFPLPLAPQPHRADSSLIVVATQMCPGCRGESGEQGGVGMAGGSRVEPLAVPGSRLEPSSILPQ